MNVDEYRTYVRNRILLLTCLAVAIGAARWIGLLEPSTTSGLQERAYVLQVLALVIVVGWVVIAAIGAVGLVRWLRTE